MTSKPPSVVITDTSDGIGLDVAKFLANKGWRVFAGVQQQADANRLSNLHENIHPLILDVTKQNKIDNAFDEVRRAVADEGLDAVINNAGSAFFGPVEFAAISDVKRQFDINVFGLIRTTQAALPLLRMGKPGRVINVGSIARHINMPYGAFYCGTKSAVECISESLRRELAKWNIKVSCIKPGAVKINFDQTGSSHAENVQRNFPVGSPSHELYGKDLENLPNAFAVILKHAAPPSKVTSVIDHALTSKHPKRFYCDTYGTYYGIGLLKRLPTRVVDRQLEAMCTAKKN